MDSIVRQVVRDIDHMIKDRGPRTIQDRGPTQDRGHSTEDTVQRTEDQGLRTEDQGARIGLTTDNWGSRQALNDKLS